MDTERRMTTQEMLTQHKKLMDKAQRLEPSVMVTERNWSALLEMQDRPFRQQMQLDADLKMFLTKREAQEALTAMQASAAEFAKQAGRLSARYSSACKELTECIQNAVTSISEEQQPGDFYGGTGIEEENLPLRVDLDYGGDLVRSAVRLGRAVEQMTDDAPTRDGTTMLPHIDSKRRRKLRQNHNHRPCRWFALAPLGHDPG